MRCCDENRKGVVRGSGNVFRDLGRENADAEQFKALLAAEIIKGIAAADFSRIRNAILGRRFTLDRLMSILNRLGSVCGKIALFCQRSLRQRRLEFNHAAIYRSYTSEESQFHASGGSFVGFGDWG